MIAENFSLEEIRKRYALDKKDKFVIRIRDSKNNRNKKAENKNDIVYYNGRKILTVANEEGNNDINIFENIFLLNKANISKAFELKTDIVTATINIRKEIENYYEFELNKFILKSSKIIKEKRELVISILEKLREELLEYINNGLISDFIPKYVYEELVKGKYEINIKNDE